MQESLIVRDREFIWHPFTPQKNRPDPIPIVKGESTLLFDESGKSYIDAISSWWVNLHGHAHPYIAQKIYEQALRLEQVIFAGFTHQPAVDLAERLIQILPGNFSKIFYSDNGSTATEVAIKMAIQYWWNREEPARKKIIALSNSYHGDTFGAMSVSERSVFTLAFQDRLFEVLFLDPEGVLPPVNLEEVACFIYEPLVQGAGGMKMYGAEWLNSILKKFKEKQVVCIADEVMTGFGRTGKLFASEFMMEKPDIICLSKGLTGGTMALGVTACTDRIFQAYINDDKSRTFFHGHSFTGNPLACTAALASLHLIGKQECMDRIEKIISFHKKFAIELQSFGSKKGADSKNGADEKPGSIKCIRQTGTILAFEISSGRDGWLNNIGTVFTQKSLELGVYLRPLGNTVYIMPPYCITDAELAKVSDTILRILASLE
jgi:adenosylmethionine-8-amino-7-oxononanoate aminotransferase